MSPVALLTGFLVGLIAGCVYFVGLYLTVRRAAKTGNPRILLFSFLARAGALMVALYALVKLGAAALVMALLGFIAARFLTVRALPGGRRET